jgi:DNA-binding transcriptional LysR family regulator
MTLEQLRIFVAVAERRHVTRAAEALRLTQSAVSAAIAALETRYGTRLFDRVGRGIELSAAGLAFLPEARAVLRQAEHAAQALDDLAGLRRGELTIAASQTVAAYWLPERLARFVQAYPGVRLKVHAGNTSQAAEAVLAGDAGFAVVEGVVEAPALQGVQVGGDHPGLYAAHDHPLVRQPATPKALRAASWILREPGSGTRAHAEAALAAAGLSMGELDVRLELPSNEAVIAAAIAGGALAAVSDLAAAPFVEAGRLARLAFAAPPRAFTRLIHRERPPSRAAAAFLARL